MYQFVTFEFEDLQGRTCRRYRPSLCYREVITARAHDKDIRDKLSETLMSDKRNLIKLLRGDSVRLDDLEKKQLNWL